MTSSNGNIFRVTGPLCGEFTGPGEFPTQRPVTRSFGVFFDLRLNKRLSKQLWGWWFETPSWSLRRHCYDFYIWRWAQHLTDEKWSKSMELQLGSELESPSRKILFNSSQLLYIFGMLCLQQRSLSARLYIFDDRPSCALICTTDSVKWGKLLQRKWCVYAELRSNSSVDPM